jgi:hypothetical protein
MMRHYKRFIFIALVIFLSGCTTQRRYHQGGIHIDWHTFGHQESSDKNHQNKSARKSNQKADQQTDQPAENRFSEQPTAVNPIPHPSNIENGPLKNKVVTRNESIISIEDQTTKFANFTNVQNANDQLSAASGSNKNPRQNKGNMVANDGDKRANDGDPDQLKNLETAAIVIYAIGLLVGILALIFWSNTLAIITAAIMSVGFVVFLCCGGKAHYFFSWVMSFLIGLCLLFFVIKRNGSFNGFFIP